MPKTSYVDITELPPAREHSADDIRAMIRAELTAARQSGKAVRVELWPDERHKTISAHYRHMAETLGVTIKMQTLARRSYTTEDGQTASEPYVFAVRVLSTIPAIQAIREGAG